MRRYRSSVPLAIGGLLLSALVTVASPTVSQASEPAEVDGCVTVGLQVTCTYLYSAADSTRVRPWTVPIGVTRAEFELWGGKGLNYGGVPGGLGGYVKSTLAGLAPGSVFEVHMGQLSPFRRPGGRAVDVRPEGAGLPGRLLVAGGGGSAGRGGNPSIAHELGTLHCYPIAIDVVTCSGAGGAGGAGGGGAGGDGGRGTSAEWFLFGGGQGGGVGGADLGGAAGLSQTDTEPTGSDGTFGFGGGSITYPTAGGGDGWYGGGAGGAGSVTPNCDPPAPGRTTDCLFSGHGGGGGGSSYAVPEAIDPMFESGVRDGNPKAVIRWTDAAPTVSISQLGAQKDPTNQSLASFVVTFSEPVDGFGQADVALSGTAGGLDSAAIAVVPTTAGPDAGKTYVVTVSGLTGPGTVTIAVPEGAAVDEYGITSLTSTAVDDTVTYDTQWPTATIGRAIGESDPTWDPTATFDVMFSEPVTGFEASDVVIGPSTEVPHTVEVTGSGATYQVRVTRSGPGTFTVDVPDLVATDLAGNLNAAATPTARGNSVRFRTAPTPMVRHADGQPSPTSTLPIRFDVFFDEDVTGFTADDVQLTGTAPGGTVRVTPDGAARYGVLVDGLTGSGTVDLKIPAGAATDEGGHETLASTSPDGPVTYRSSTAPPPPPPPPPPAPPTPWWGGTSGFFKTTTVPFLATFDHPVHQVITNRITFLGTAPGPYLDHVTGGPTSRFFHVVVSGDGTVGMRFAPGAIVGANGVANTATIETPLVTVDAEDPTVTVEQAADQADPTREPTAQFSVRFSEPVTGFDATDLVLGGTAPGATAEVTGSGAAYDVVVRGMSASGSVTVAVPPGAAEDSAGNPTPASTSADAQVTYDIDPPRTTVVTKLPATLGYVFAARAAARFASDEAGSTFLCWLDDVATPCPQGTWTLPSRLAPGKHVLTARAVDQAGNEGPPRRLHWHTPLDDTDLEVVSGFNRDSGGRSYAGTYSVTWKKGSVLRSRKLATAPVVVAYTSLPDGGSFTVHLGSKRLGTVHTAAAKRASRFKLFRITGKSPRGKVRITTLDDGKPVRIDALGVR